MVATANILKTKQAEIIRVGDFLCYHYTMSITAQQDSNLHFLIFSKKYPTQSLPLLLLFIYFIKERYYDITNKTCCRCESVRPLIPFESVEPLLLHEKIPSSHRGNPIGNICVFTNHYLNVVQIYTPFTYLQTFLKFIFL